MDDTGIANMALQGIGSQVQIASLSEISPEAAAVNLIYAQTRNGLLRQYMWNWARRQLALAVLKAAQGTPENPTGTGALPPTPWRYSYAYPSDAIRLRYLLPEVPTNQIAGVPISPVSSVVPIMDLSRQPPIAFREAGDVDSNGNAIKVILANQFQAKLIYTGRVYDPNIWDELFVDAFVGRLAKQLVTPLSGDKTLAKLAIQTGAAAEAVAAVANGNEGIVMTDRNAEWTMARGFPESNIGLMSDLD